MACTNTLEPYLVFVPGQQQQQRRKRWMSERYNWCATTDIFQQHRTHKIGCLSGQGVLLL